MLISSVVGSFIDHCAGMFDTMGDFIFPLKECLKLSLNGNESFSAN